MQFLRRLEVQRVELTLLVCGSCVLGACGGGVALLHPAHTLPAGRASIGAGVSDRFLLGSERSAERYARERATDGVTTTPDPRFTSGVLVALAEGPLLAPWAAARVGLPGTNEVGLSFTGPALRADARHAFESDRRALSVGVGVTGRSLGRGALNLQGTELDTASGFGVDVPVLFGYRTDADLISAWAGLRAGYDRFSGTVTLEPNAKVPVKADRWSAGPLVGLALGVAPIYVAVEIELDYSHVTGSLAEPGAGQSATIFGLSLHPAGALIGQF